MDPDLQEVMPSGPMINTGPTLTDLTFDENLDDVDRCVTYGASGIALQRLVHARILAETARTAGYDRVVSQLLPLLDPLSDDDEVMIRTATAEQLASIACTLVATGGEDGYNLVLETILPAIGRLLTDPETAVRSAAVDALVGVSERVIRPGDLGLRVLTLVLKLAHEEEEEDLRAIAAQLLNALAHILGPELVLQFVLPELICLAEDPLFKVRKSVALHCDAVAVAVGPSTAVKRLLPAFKTLCRDDIWGVRRACAEAIVDVSRALDPSVRLSELAPLFEKLCVDPSKWVRGSAYQWAGPFIATLPGAKVPPSLLAHYVRAGLAGCTPLPIGGAGAGAGSVRMSGGIVDSGGGADDVPSTADTGYSPHAASKSGSSGSSNSASDVSGSGAVGQGSSGNSTSSSVSSSESADTPRHPSTTTTTSAPFSSPATGNHLTGDLDMELAVVTAFSFPGVCLTLGRSRWQSELRPLWIALSRDLQKSVRRTLACALHELARILGPEITASDLLPAFDLYLSDPSEEVRFGIIRNSAAFLSCLPATTREAYLPALAEMRDGCAPRNWRARRALARQVGSFASLFSPLSTYSVVLPWTFALLMDPVADVRNQAAAGLGPLLTRISQARFPSGVTAVESESNVNASVLHTSVGSSSAPDGAVATSATHGLPSDNGQPALEPRSQSPASVSAAPAFHILLQEASNRMIALASSHCHRHRALFVRICSHLATGLPPPQPRHSRSLTSVPADGEAASSGTHSEWGDDRGSFVASAPLFPPVASDVFVQYFMQPLLALASDPVPNVRLLVAAAIGNPLFSEVVEEGAQRRAGCSHTGVEAAAMSPSDSSAFLQTVDGAAAVPSSSSLPPSGTSLSLSAQSTLASSSSAWLSSVGSMLSGLASGSILHLQAMGQHAGGTTVGGGGKATVAKGVHGHHSVGDSGLVESPGGPSSVRMAESTSASPKQAATNDDGSCRGGLSLPDLTVSSSNTRSSLGSIDDASVDGGSGATGVPRISLADFVSGDQQCEDVRADTEDQAETKTLPSIQLFDPATAQCVPTSSSADEHVACGRDEAVGGNPVVAPGDVVPDAESALASGLGTHLADAPSEAVRSPSVTVTDDSPPSSCNIGRVVASAAVESDSETISELQRAIQCLACDPDSEVFQTLIAAVGLDDNSRGTGGVQRLQQLREKSLPEGSASVPLHGARTGYPRSDGSNHAPGQCVAAPPPSTVDHSDASESGTPASSSQSDTRLLTFDFDYSQEHEYAASLAAEEAGIRASGGGISGPS